MGTKVRFWMDAYKNEAASKTAGRAVFDTVPWCEKGVVGESDTVSGPVHKMLPDPREEFQAAWAAFQRDNSSEGLVGTPLREVPWLGRGEVETLLHSGVKTLEQLAGMSDATITGLPGGLAMRKKAKDMLKAAEESAPAQALAEELAKRDSEIQSLKAQIAEILESKRRKKTQAAEE